MAEITIHPKALRFDRSGVMTRRKGFTMTDLKPGRELDSRVATEVMGIPKFDLKVLDKIGAHIFLREDSNCIMCGAPEGYNPECLPPYSTDIAAAWQVVEKLKSDGYYFAVSNGPIHFDNGRRTGTNDLWATFGRSGDRISNSIGETSPHAICLAALKAITPE